MQIKIERRLAIRKGMIYHIKTTNDKGISRKTKKEIDEALHKCFKQFPELKGWIGEIVFDNTLGPFEIAKSTYSNGSIKLKLNKKIFMNKVELDNLIKTSPNTFTPKEKLEDYLIHEMYHILEFRYAILQNTYENKIDYTNLHNELETLKYPKDILHEALECCGLPYDYVIIKKEISEYATYDYAEAIAEAGSGGKTKLCDEIVRLVNKKWRTK